ncbi:aminotransferase class I/II-fold pyridoxal phosphate-dependent enzyme [Alcanivorax sp.]|uniref:aminotransferase class I/II-fold pyridoxal phosphate-dependent enzyme n=1 Tax=Alcanivorax sp. TaxID=1872427 RepID=UPI0025C0972A|nr:aminotransferase class I/II-fold pyridoxal phosphate-dependent enzyme [Alcanivorax sp.]
MTPSLSDFARRIPPFHVMALLERAQALSAQGHDVIHLEVGEPDFATPEPVLAAIQDAVAHGHTGYTPAAGLPALREAIAEDYQNRFAAKVSPAQVVVTPGASGALQLALAALLNPGDGVLLTDPGYPCNRQFVRLVGGEPQPVALQADSHFNVDPVAFLDAWQANTRVVMVASPDNPTGNMLPVETLQQLARGAVDKGGILLVDEIYQGLCYTRPASSVLAGTDQVLVINSFSKYFCMTGWRLGWLVAPEPLVPAIERLAQNLFLAPSTPAQHGALAALQEPTLTILEQRHQLLARRRQCLLNGLAHLKLPVVSQADGAFYVYADVSDYTDDSFAFCADLLEKAKVAMTPGLDFGESHDHRRFVRMAYTCSEARLTDALHRLEQYLESL